MLYMCDHLESVDLSGWNITADSNHNGMFRYNGVRTIKMHGCNIATIRSVFASLEEDGGRPDLQIELTPDTYEHDMYLDLMSALIRYKSLLSLSFSALSDMASILVHLEELIGASHWIMSNPIFTCVNQNKEKEGLSRILRLADKCFVQSQR